MVLDFIDHGRAEHGVHELRAGQGEEGSEERAGEEDGRGDGGVGEEATEESGVGGGEEDADGGEAEASAGVDVVMGAADEAVEVGFKGARRSVVADGGEVGGSLAVEEAEVAEVGGGEGFETAGLDDLYEGFEAGPVFFAEFNPAV